jgi:hypothetical protein
MSMPNANASDSELSGMEEKRMVFGLDGIWMVVLSSEIDGRNFDDLMWIVDAACQLPTNEVNGMEDGIMVISGTRRERVK